MTGRDFTVEELIGRQIRIESLVPNDGKPPLGYNMAIFADDVSVTNVVKLVLTIEPIDIVKATLYLVNRSGKWEDLQTEEVTLQDNIRLSFSAIVSEVQDGS